MARKLFDNRFLGIALKAVRAFRNYLSALSLRLQVASCGRGLCVNGPVRISGGKNVSIGNGCRIGRDVVLDAAGGPIRIQDDVKIRDHAKIYAKDVQIGAGSTIAEGSFLVGHVKLGNGVWVARGCDLSGITVEDRVIFGPNASSIPANHGRSAGGEVSLTGDFTWVAIHIETGAWVGARAILLKGIRIGRNAVVGAGSVVTKSVASATVVAGVPAKPIKSSLDVPGGLS